MADHLRLRPPHRAYLHGLKTAVAQAGQQGNVVFVGRGTRHLLVKRPAPSTCGWWPPQTARAAWRAFRAGRPRGARPLTEIDRTLDHFHRYFFGSKPRRPLRMTSWSTRAG